MFAEGVVVGRYTIVRRIGAGGMGEVYEARDSTLGRTIALKVLPADRATDPERVRRFVREAEAASSLQHPTIVSVIEAGTADVDGTTLHFLAMERIEGETFSNWMRSRHELPRILDVLAQVADGLARAHAGGIVHRDLKPDNIMVTPDGYAKILDFGVAKLVEPRDDDASASTMPRALVGTAAYMSPEQIEGRNVDARTDTFALGCVLYEAIARRPAFRKATFVDTLSAIAHEEPEPLEDVSSDLQRVVRRCLAKDPEERYHSIKDVALDLREIAPRERSASRSKWLVAALVFAAIAVVAIAAFVFTRRHAASAAATAPQMEMSRLTNRGDVIAAAISGDGRYLVYATGIATRHTLWLRQIAAGTEVELAPPGQVEYRRIRISRDGESIFYTATVSDRNVYDLWQRPLLGGAPRRIAQNTEELLAVSPDGRSVAFRRYDVPSRRSSLVVSDLTTGRERTLLVRELPKSIGAVAWRTDDRIVFTELERAPRFHTVLMQIRTDGGRAERLTPQEWISVSGLEVLADGSGALMIGDTAAHPPRIVYVPFDGGAPRSITTDVSFCSDLTVTADGNAVVATRNDITSNLYVRPLESDGAMRPVTSGQNLYGLFGVRWLPNGDLVFNVPNRNRGDLFTISAEGRELRRLTQSYGTVWPAVSAAAGRIAFISLRSGTHEVWTCDLNGTSLTQVTRAGQVIDADFFPDGRAIAWSAIGDEHAIWASDLATGKSRKIVSSPASGVSVAPDGRTALARVRSLHGEQPLWQTALVSLERGEVLQRFDVPRRMGTPRFAWLPGERAFAYVDGGERGGANIWIRELEGGEPRQVTDFTSGRIYSFDVNARRELVVAHGTPLRNAVMIRNFR